MTIPLDEDGPPVAHLVIGVVSDVRQSHADTDLKDVYLALAQRADRFAFMYLRSPRTPSWRSDLRAAVAAIDREVAVGTPRWLSLGFDDERARPEFVASLLAVFAAFASVLALVGMHGVIAYAVGQRERPRHRKGSGIRDQGSGIRDSRPKVDLGSRLLATDQQGSRWCRGERR